MFHRPILFEKIKSLDFLLDKLGPLDALAYLLLIPQVGLGHEGLV